MNEQTSAWKSKHSVGKLEEIVDVEEEQEEVVGASRKETSDVMYRR